MFLNCRAGFQSPSYHSPDRDQRPRRERRRRCWIDAKQRPLGIAFKPAARGRRMGRGPAFGEKLVERQTKTSLGRGRRRMVGRRHNWSASNAADARGADAFFASPLPQIVPSRPGNRPAPRCRTARHPLWCPRPREHGQCREGQPSQSSPAKSCGTPCVPLGCRLPPGLRRLLGRVALRPSTALRALSQVPLGRVPANARDFPEQPAVHSERSAALPARAQGGQARYSRVGPHIPVAQNRAPVGRDFLKLDRRKFRMERCTVKIAHQPIRSPPVC